MILCQKYFITLFYINTFLLHYIDTVSIMYDKNKQNV